MRGGWLGGASSLLDCAFEQPHHESTNIWSTDALLARTLCKEMGYEVFCHPNSACLRLPVPSTGGREAKNATSPTLLTPSRYNARE